MSIEKRFGIRRGAVCRLVDGLTLSWEKPHPDEQMGVSDFKVHFTMPGLREEDVRIVSVSVETIAALIEILEIIRRETARPKSEDST